MPAHEVLFIPGPVEVDEELRSIMAMPLVGHRSPGFVSEVQAVCAKLPGLFLTNPDQQGSATLFENAPATALMEAGIRNLVPRGGRILHLTCGAFSERWAKISNSCGRHATKLSVDWGATIPPSMLRQKLQEEAAFDAVCITHNETSTGVLADLQSLAQVVSEESPQTLILVDAVTSVGGTELQFDQWGIDLAFAGTQKCLALPPGLCVYAVSRRALEIAETVDERGFLLDFLGARKGLADGKTIATPNVPLVFALSRQLDRIAQETLQARWDRHTQMRDTTIEWAERHQFEPFVDAAHRSTTVTALCAPGRDVMELAAQAKRNGFAMDKGYGKLKGEAFRIGHMGDHTLERLQQLLAVLA